MAKQLTNTSRNVQFLKTATPGGVLYASSIQIRPGQTLIVSDEDFAFMTIPSFIRVTYIQDAVIDTVEEVLDVGGGGSGTPEDSAATPSTLVLRDGLGAFAATAMQSDLIYALTGDATVNLNTGVIDDIAGVQSIDWASRALIDTASVSAVDWATRLLRNSSAMGTVDWQNCGLATNGIARVDWAGGMLIDMLGDNGSVNWNNRILVAANGTDPALNWDLRQLIDASGDIAQSWTVAGQSGTTLARPVTTSLATGYMFFDTTLGQPIWWDGAAWVDATGAPI